MALQLAGHTINRIAVLDDNPAMRASLAEFVVDLGASAIDFPGPLDDLIVTVDKIVASADAVIADYRLMHATYSPGYDGDAVIARCFEKKRAGVLCTSYSDVFQTLHRSERFHIPSVLASSALDLESMKRGFERSLGEIYGNFIAERRPWRTQVQIADVPDKEPYFYVTLSGWSVRDKIRLFKTDIPQELHALIATGRIFHAQVNTGARRHEDLYFTNWEDK